MLVIEVKELVKRFGGLTAVDGVSFSVEQGEIFGFLGPNGAGKTTTIGILCTLLRPTGGRATVNGHDVVHQQTAVRQSIGLVFQDPSLDIHLTAEENLQFHAYIYNVPARVRRARVEEVLRLVELWERRRDLVRTFSGGMKRRLEIARGLLHFPKVLFLDEPTLGLDPQTREHIWQYILDLRQREGITIFLTTHYMEEAQNCDHIAIIDGGKIVAMDTPGGLKSLVGGDIIHLKTEDDGQAIMELARRYEVEAKPGNGFLQFEVRQGDEFIPKLVRDLGTRILSVSLSRPTLDDVFLKLTGHAIRDESGAREAQRILAQRWQRRR
ncbi:MAG: ATP-binding cassette domain-containing protein [Chloroflexi bacterium]|nr:ATP-binding cassette domain-containing protein [Chloroflexota bacterium]